MQDTHTYEELQELLFRFESVLQSNGVRIEAGSSLERVSLQVMSMLEKYETEIQKQKDRVAIRDYFMEYMGYSDFIGKIVNCSESEHFEKLMPHLRLLNRAKVVDQHSKSLSTDQINNKLFELFVACLCISAGCESIDLDDPESSKGDNPDIMASFEGVMWGFGCKALQSDNHLTIFNNLESAVDQIKRSRSAIGIPVLSMKNVLDRNKFWPILYSPINGEAQFGAFLDTSSPCELAIKNATEIFRPVVEQFGSSGFSNLFQDPRVEGACLLYLPIASPIVHGSSFAPARINLFYLMRFFDVGRGTEILFQRLNHHLQVLR